MTASEHLARLDAWRARPRDEQASAFVAGEPDPTPPPFDPRRRARVKLLVLDCDYRGPRSTCGCDSTRICLKGNGRPVPGTGLSDVTTRDCERCVQDQS